MKDLLNTLMNKQRKLFVSGACGLSICAGFCVVAWRQPGSTLDAYKIGTEWLVYLAAFFGGANALTHFAAARAPSKPPGE